ncbi:hypothetical protein Tco_1265900 [Tanacetum coccineum]
MDQLEKQLDKEEFQEIGSMAALKYSRHSFRPQQKQRAGKEVDTRPALDASLVDTESSGTESKERITSSRSWNDFTADKSDIIPYIVKSNG